MDLDEIISQLDQHHQRASYGAVAGILGRAAIGLMAGRPHSRRDSWVVATANGRPTNYADDEIHPVCLRQIRESADAFIKDIGLLAQWLNDQADT